VKSRPNTHTKCGTEVSSSVPHFLQVGSLLSHIVYRCLLKVLCPVTRPITTLDCVLLKDNDGVFLSRSGPEISSEACLCTTRITLQYQMLVCYPAFYLSSYILPRDPQERLRSIKQLNRTALVSLSTVSSHSGMPRDPLQPRSVPGKDIVHHLLAQCWLLALCIMYLG